MENSTTLTRQDMLKEIFKKVFGDHKDEPAVKIHYDYVVENVRYIHNPEIYVLRRTSDGTGMATGTKGNLIEYIDKYKLTNINWNNY